MFSTKCDTAITSSSPILLNISLEVQTFTKSKKLTGNNYNPLVPKTNKQRYNLIIQPKFKLQVYSKAIVGKEFPDASSRKTFVVENEFINLQVNQILALSDLD